MRIGVGLPATIPRASGGLTLDWARRADAGPFSSLGLLDRIAYDSLESLTTLAAAAAVTERIQLATSIVIAPLRPTALLAKQAATIQALSGGRLVLGVGIGAREDDYELTETDYRRRGTRLTDQLVQLRRHWEEGTVGSGVGRRPRLLVGGSGGWAASRMARFADGYIHGGGPPRAFLRAAIESRAAWSDLGRPGAPELWGMAYFQLGGDPEIGRAYLRDYYAFTGPFAARIASGLLTTPDEIAETAGGYAEAGCDELLLFPVVASLDQLERLTEVLARTPSLLPL